ncbi:MAG: conjugal transfer protein TraA [Pseudomonadota bacterium]
MDKGSPISLWFSEDDRRCLDQAAALAGYRHVSTYIRDRAMGRISTHLDAGLGGAHGARLSWPGGALDLREQLEELERRQRSMHAICAMLLFLVRARSTTGEVSELLAACHGAGEIEGLLAGAFPQLAQALRRLADEG